MSHMNGERRITAERAADLHRMIRSFLMAQMGRESAAAIVGAMMYEIASLAATVSPTEREATQLLATFFDAAKRQIEAFGVGRPHP